MRRLLGLGLLGFAITAFAPALPGRQGHIDPKPRTIHLFNGKDLTNFYTYLGKSPNGDKPYGRNIDPERVFSIKDGAIRVSGQVFGCFVTEKEYENYHLVVEYKWGQQTFFPRDGKARDSGILLHCVGEDGAAGGVWLESIECQMIEGGTGDFILVAGKNKPSLTVEAQKRDGQYYYKPGAKPLTLNAGRFNWYGRDPKWRDVKGFRGKNDVEKPIGQWNNLECICDGDKITIILNGKVVNAGTKASHTRGKILFQSEGAEVFFRKIDLKMLKDKQ
jgi:hypothetical protein